MSKGPREIPLAIVGASGRMGRLLAAAASHDARFSLTGLVDSPAHSGDTIPELPHGPRLAGTIDALPRAPRVVIEFAHPSVSADVARWCAARGAALLVGTTGHAPAMHATWDEAAERIPVLVAPNTSVGVTALLAHLGGMAQALVGFDAHIVEAHHRAKRDAPSGTALALRDALERPVDQVPTSSIRAGSIPGVHTVLFAGAAERIEITHVAESRECFVAGALRAAAWLAEQAPGRYSMRDVIAAAPEAT